jgi:hypothetical protein
VISASSAWPFGIALSNERLVRRVLEQPPHQVRHARHEIADGRVDPHAHSEPAERGVHRLRHAVEELVLERLVR